MKQENRLESDTENHIFEIKGCYYKKHCFPGLNEYIHALGTNPRAGARMKKDYQMIACNAIRLGLGRFRTDKPIILHYHFQEPQKGQKRDRMNIFAFADKVILDALQKCGVIQDDGPKHVINTSHTFDYTDNDPSIRVAIQEVEK